KAESLPAQDSILQIAMLADPDDWRSRLRSAILKKDQAILDQLAKEENCISQPLPTVLLLVRALEARSSDSVTAAGEAILRQVQRKHPNDFWVNVELANCLSEEEVAEEVGFRRIAVALRPQSASAITALATSLTRMGNSTEASTAFDDAEKSYR